MRLVCISAAHTPYNGKLMERSAKRVGVEIVRFKEGEPWPKDYRVGKLVHGLECVKRLPEDVTHVMFSDGSDTLFLGGPEEIIEKFEAICPNLALVSAEKNCYPYKDLAQEYPAAYTEWRYVNSGNWILRRSDAEYMLEKIAGLTTYGCDQLAWTRAYLQKDSFAVKLDENCQLFQSMYLQKEEEFRFVDGRMENLVTGGRPCVLHWNGTKNAGVPFSRDGVWQMIDPKYEVEAPKGPKSLCVLMPGSSFSNRFVAEWTGLFMHLICRFHLRMAWGEGNNIYGVREQCLNHAMGDPTGRPDYLLWLDSDNPPSIEGFDLLWAAMEASPEVSTVGGWYRFFSPVTQTVSLAAGIRTADEKFCNLTEEQVIEAEHLIEVEFIGFGFCLMKRQVVEDIGIAKCFEPYHHDPPKNGRTWATDDDGFFIRAREAGHRVFVHPGVFLEHEKRMNVPAKLEPSRTEILIPATKEL